MILDAKEIKLRNGKTCIFRTPRKEDGAAVLEYTDATSIVKLNVTSIIYNFSFDNAARATYNIISIL